MQVNITSVEKKIDPGNNSEYTAYIVEVRLGNDTWTVSRRFNEFDTLYTKVKAAFPKFKFDDFPTKELFKKNSPALIEERRNKFNQFLKTLINDPASTKLFTEIGNFLELHRRAKSDALKAAKPISNDIAPTSVKIDSPQAQSLPEQVSLAKVESKLQLEQETPDSDETQDKIEQPEINMPPTKVEIQIPPQTTATIPLPLPIKPVLPATPTPQSEPIRKVDNENSGSDSDGDDWDHPKSKPQVPVRPKREVATNSPEPIKTQEEKPTSKMLIENNPAPVVTSAAKVTLAEIPVTKPPEPFTAQTNNTTQNLVEPLKKVEDKIENKKIETKIENKKPEEKIEKKKPEENKKIEAKIENKKPEELPAVNAPTNNTTQKLAPEPQSKVILPKVIPKGDNKNFEEQAVGPIRAVLKPVDYSKKPEVKKPEESRENATPPSIPQKPNNLLPKAFLKPEEKTNFPSAEDKSVSSASARRLTEPSVDRKLPSLPGKNKGNALFPSEPKILPTLRQSESEKSTGPSTTTTTAISNPQRKALPNVPPKPHVVRSDSDDENEDLNKNENNEDIELNLQQYTKSLPPPPPPKKLISMNEQNTNEALEELGEEWLDFMRERLLKGQLFLKIGRKGKPQKRLLWLSEDFTELRWKDPTNIKNVVNIITKHPRSLNIFEITSIVSGQVTEVFLAQNRAETQDKSFSIIADSRSIDLEIVEERPTRDEWVKAFKLLIENNNEM